MKNCLWLENYQGASCTIQRQPCRVLALSNPCGGEQLRPHFGAKHASRLTSGPASSGLRKVTLPPPHPSVAIHLFAPIAAIVNCEHSPDIRSRCSLYATSPAAPRGRLPASLPKPSARLPLYARRQLFSQHGRPPLRGSQLLFPCPQRGERTAVVYNLHRRRSRPRWLTQ